MANNRNDNRGGEQERERDSMGRFKDEDGGNQQSGNRGSQGGNQQSGRDSESNRGNADQPREPPRPEPLSSSVKRPSSSRGWSGLPRLSLRLLGIGWFLSVHAGSVLDGTSHAIRRRATHAA